MEEYLQGFVSTSIVKTLLAPLERYKLIRQTQDILTLSSKEKMTNFYYNEDFVFNYNFLRKQFKMKDQKDYSDQIQQQFTCGYLRCMHNMFSIKISNKPLMTKIFCQWDFVQHFAALQLNKIEQIIDYDCTTSIFSYPFDTIRVRQATEIQIPGQKRMYVGFEETRFNIKIESGFFKGLYSGFTVGCLQTLLFAYGIVGLNYVLDGTTPYNQQLAYLGSYALIYPIDSVRRRLQVKSILFQQEASKKQNLWDKLKFNMKEWNFSWGYGGFLAHNVRGIAMLLILEQVNFESLYKETYNQLNQALKY